MQMQITLQPNTLDLTIVIPTLNEGPNLEVLLPELHRSLDSLGITWEVLVVDHNSSDNTQQIVQQHATVYIGEDTPGYGPAIVRGIIEARGARVLTMDADLSHPAPFVETLWNHREDADLLIASRYIPGGEANQPWMRLQLSRVLNTFFRLGVGIPVLDLSSGFRLYRKEILDGLTIEFHNFVIVIELLLKTWKNGYTVREVPFRYEPRGEGLSKARILEFGLDYLRLFARIRFGARQ